MIDNQGSILVSIYNTVNGRRNNNVGTNNIEESLEMGNAWMQPQTSEAPNLKSTNGNFTINHQLNNPMNKSSFSTPSFYIDRSSIIQSPSEITSDIGQPRHLDGSSSNSKEWSRIYLFGSEHKIGVPRIQRPS